MTEALGALLSLLPGIPVFLVQAIGVVLALVRLRTHRRSSSLLAAGLGGLLVQRLMLTPLYTLMPIFLNSRGFAVADYGMIYAGLATGESLFSAVWYGLIIAAVVLPDEPPPLVGTRSPA